MEINLFNDASLAPQPKSKIRIEEFHVSPYADRFRVKVNLKLTPFLERPNSGDHRAPIGRTAGERPGCYRDNALRE